MRPLSLLLLSFLLSVDGAHEVIFADQDLLLGSSNSLSIAGLIAGAAATSNAVVGVGIIAGDSNILDAEETALDIIWALGIEDVVPFHRGAGQPWVVTGEEVRLQQTLTGGKVGDGWLGEWNPSRTPADVRRGVRWELGFSNTQWSPIGSLSAAEAIVNAARNHPGRLHLVMLGPLTNLATALVIEPRLPELVSQLTVMGGALNVKSKFNFWWDPHAAARVLRTKWKRKTLVPIDVCQLTTTTREVLERVAEAIPPHCPVARDWIRRQYSSERIAKHHAELGLPMWDELTAVIALAPESGVITETFQAWVDVELMPGQARGSTHWWDVKLVHKASPPHWANAVGPWQIVTNVNVTRFEDEFVSFFRSTTGRWCHTERDL